MTPTHKKIIIAIGAFIIIALGVVLVLQNYRIKIDKKQNVSFSTLTELEARTIAEASCIKGGGALYAGSYNPNSKTWWFDANLNAVREGCDPACVVSEETKTAEINWRCTGFIPPNQVSPTAPPTSDECRIVNCHGLDIECGGTTVQVCTEMYQLGDKCRQFAKCGKVNGKCQQIENPEFNTCKACVQKCERNFPNNPEKASACESKC